ncbi:MBL fold metallo-hydrolase [Pseudonocardia bannensis]|uniref:MBL fold metallo-hydrolase n=1 Tax=Pseudonocardia bannensis TaxID=630973 RepID=A0A848DDK9_9PSEU|nr:MBL fold metallo-hydrolase [Pseudonocardia bannensis]NMH90690.1 MBL fold metallo-hydrolase [Pseudonocardia bannensis]
MQITHFGHACVLLDTGAARLLIDPGLFSTGFEDLTGLNAIMITHQHFDHLDADRLDPLLRANPDARLIVDAGSAEKVADREHEVTRPGDTLQVAGARVDVLGGDHAVIHPDVPMIPNNGYLVDGTHLHPGDAYVPAPQPGLQVLFVPAGAPWLKIGEVVDYLRAVAPRTAVPIHEAVLSKAGQKVHYGLLEQLAPEGTAFRVLDREPPAPTTL